MIASPPFVHALPQPVQVAPGRGAKAQLVARTPVPPVMCPSIRAARNLPGSARAPKLMATPRLQAPAVASGRSVARGAALLSTALHLGLVAGWAVFAAPARPLAVPDLETAEVALISEAQFSALTAPQPQLAMALVPSLGSPAPLPVLDTLAPPDAAPPVPAPTPDLAPAPLPPEPMAAADLPPPMPDPPAAAPKPEPKVASVEETPKPKAQTPQAKQPAAANVPTPKVKDTGAASTEPAKAAAPGKTASKGEAKALTADWGAKVRSRINRKLMVPKGTAPGRAKVRVTIAPSGALLAVEIVESSGQPALDAAALKAAKSAAPFPRAPKGLSDASYSFTVPIRQDG